MTEWQPSTFEGFLRKVNRALAKSDRVSVGAANKADDAQATADVAAQQAVAAAAAAAGAVTSANGKNTIKFRIAAPTTSAADAGTADGDLWFVIPNVNTGIVTGQYTWMAATQSWVQQTLSSAVLASIDAGKITTGTLVGITITGVTITGSTVTGGTVQTSSTGKRVVLSNNVINFYGIDGTQAVNAGLIEGIPNGAAGGLINISSGSGGGATVFGQFGTQALPTSGSATFRVPGQGWFGGLFVEGGIDGSGGTMTGRAFRAPVTNDASLTSTGHAFQIGDDSGLNLIIDNNEIMVRNNGATNSLSLQADGGNTVLGSTANGSVNYVNGIFVNPLLPSRIAAGIAQPGPTSVANGAVITVGVTFPSGRFTQAPVMTATCVNGRLTPEITSVSATSATITLRNSSGAAASGTFYTHWQAMDAG